MNWIKVEDKEPEQMQKVLVAGENIVAPAFYIENVFISMTYYSIDLNEVTHWMPFPDPPQD